jgi:hypothetical protein
MMNKKSIKWWVIGAYDFLNILIGIAILVPFLIVIPVISAAGAIIGFSRSTSFDPSTYLQGRMMTGTATSISEYGIRRRRVE